MRLRTTAQLKLPHHPSVQTVTISTSADSGGTPNRLVVRSVPAYGDAETTPWQSERPRERDPAIPYEEWNRHWLGLILRTFWRTSSSICGHKVVTLCNPVQRRAIFRSI